MMTFLLAAILIGAALYYFPNLRLSVGFTVSVILTGIYLNIWRRK
jgi:hypothetical protein